VNLANCSRLGRQPLTGTWYRALEPRHLYSALQTSQTRQLPSRFHEGASAQPQFELLYLAVNQMVALFEVRSLFGTMYTPGAVVPNPVAPTRIPIAVHVTLQAIVDLTDSANVDLLETSTQELTGDWEHYQTQFAPALPRLRRMAAPTQQVGAALAQVPDIEGFVTVSAPTRPYTNLVIYPGNLQPGSQIRTVDPLTGQVLTIP